jgi:hypothetical protein
MPMKSKEQKRAEAIERAKNTFRSKRMSWGKRHYTEEEYLDLFRTKDEIEQRQYDKVL